MMLKQHDGTYVESPIHAWFGLTYSSYFVMPRLALESLPLAWQQRFVALMEEAYSCGMRTPSYHVLREGIEYTLVEKEDSEDETSRDYEFTALPPDPWANYRHGDAQKLITAMKDDEG